MFRSIISLFDCHFHIIEKEFPLQANNGYIPDEFTIEDYRDRLSDYSIQGGAVVSGSFQGFDQTYLTSALNRLGPGFVGVTQLPVTVTDEEILDFIAREGESAYHPTSTCKMGVSSMSVTDPNLSVHGIQNLRIVDASVFPYVTNGNIYSPVMMLAEKAADLILEKTPLAPEEVSYFKAKG